MTQGLKDRIETAQPHLENKSLSMQIGIKHTI